MLAMTYSTDLRARTVKEASAIFGATFSHTMGKIKTLDRERENHLALFYLQLRSANPAGRFDDALKSLGGREACEKARKTLTMSGLMNRQENLHSNISNITLCAIQIVESSEERCAPFIRIISPIEKV